MNEHIRFYTTEKLSALTAEELIKLNNQLNDRTKLEIALTQKLEETLEFLQEIQDRGN